MSLGQSITTVFRKYEDSSGSSWAEFWWFVLFCALVHAALQTANLSTSNRTTYFGSSLSALWSIVVLVPLLAASVRRLRDAGRP
jgi:uncharacterized membrane protein YhaH (DUF805 family)